MISEGEWASIREMVAKLVTQITGGRRNFKTGRVVKRDVSNRLVWIRDLGDQPIPVVGFDYIVKYYDTDSTGVVTPKTATASPVIPAVGDHVFVVLEMGEQSLPRCLGKIQGKKWIIPEQETGGVS